MRIAIFGGTFDPIHTAHIQVAAEAARAHHLDQVVFIPSGQPPHKPGNQLTPYAHRVRMVELACAGDSRFTVSRIEERAGKSYSFDTIRQIQATLGPDDELFFLIGADAFAEVRTWYHWREVIGLVRFIVVTRPGYSYDVPEGAQVDRLEGVELPVSSTEVRRELAAGRRPADLPSAVLDYIEEHRLYQSHLAGVGCTESQG